MPVEIGARGFVGSSVYGLLSKLSIGGNKRTKALRLLAETAENSSRWIWSRRNEKKPDPLGTYATPSLAMYHTLILLFEVDYLATIIKPLNDNQSSTLHFGSLSFLFLATFLLFMPLLLVNLMIGLAVGDIQSVLRSANQKKLATQVDFHTNLERRLSFLSKMTPEILTVYPWSSDNSFQSKIIEMIGWKNELIAELPALSSQNAEESPTMQSITEARRELGQLKRSLTLIMKKLNVDTEGNDVSDQPNRVLSNSQSSSFF
ncbi:transient receptor potential cation channel subfamily a member 1-like [Plakobranchus ocellatus]|uniref:Transient receptor potential cation channel subfamily a member 1-like n=1 Tax=Plakobranchus ocellatus TaxID=259542 RepID=A0AAV3YXH7_9GAST|nr:transient receptor potential cation channel subfamily a member 1-like [Plakobranchus ocellatus]